MASGTGADGSEQGKKRPDSSNLHQGGSVKRARQSVNVELPTERPVIGTVPPPVPSTIPQAENSPPSNPPNILPILPGASLQPPALPLRSALRPRPPTILIPVVGSVSASQWNQRQGNSFWQQDTTRNQPPEPTVRRGPPPPRPPRPDIVPPLPLADPKIDHLESQQQEPTSAHQNQLEPGEKGPSVSPEDGGKRGSDESSSPSNQSPPTENPEIPHTAASSTPSPPTRRVAHLGPPPSARKGAAMYYSQKSLVSPIPEEMPEGSSHVIPSSWGDGPPSYYMEEHGEEESRTAASSILPADGSATANSQAGAGDLNTSRRSKGSSKELSSDQMLGFQETYSPAALSPISAANSDTSRSRLWTAGPVSETSSPVDQQNRVRQAPEGGNSTFLAPPSGYSPPNVSPISPATRTHFPLYPESQTPANLRTKHTHGNPEQGGPVGTNATVSPLTSRASSTREKEPKQPAGPSLTGLQNREVRSSQSSLPELIRRATKLASNLDRSRNASRVGAWDELRRNEKSTHGEDSNSISDILAAFPSPSSSSPTGERNSQRRPSPIGKSSLSNVQSRTNPSKLRPDPRRRRGRRCGGMPLWLLALLCLILLLLITAAIIIPVTLIVLPKQHGKKPATLTSCIQDYPCINGGINVLVQKSCRCVCSHGFTGSTCGTAAEPGCTTADFTAPSGTVYRNATIGSGVPRLLFNASTNFSIPLDTTNLLSVFSSTNLSCSDENQLITFNDRERRRRSLPRHFATPKLSNPNEWPERGPSILSPHTTQAPLLKPTLFPRDDNPPSPQDLSFYGDDVNTNVITSNDILLAGPTGVVNSPSSSATATGPETSVPTATAAPIPPEAFDFARVAVLFILQERSLNDAVVARDRFSDALKNPQTYDINPINAGQSVEVDFSKLTLNLGNGTWFGGKA